MSMLNIIKFEEGGRNFYALTRSKIDYTFVLEDDGLAVWKNNNMLGSLSCDKFFKSKNANREMRNNLGKPMPKFMQKVYEFITLDVTQEHLH